MSTRKQTAAMLDIGAGTTLIIVGNNNPLPHWSTIEHWWPLMVIIAGLVMWLSDMEDGRKTRHSRLKLEIPYGK